MRSDRMTPLDVEKTLTTLKKLPTHVLQLAKLLHARNMDLHASVLVDMQDFTKQMDEVAIGIEDELYARIGGNEKLLGSKPVWTPPEDGDD